MANRAKEDEKNERIIRGLLKLPENRRCINCNSLGPQYVCINFWTFVCTTCSGIHREFTHRVKSISMAKFTSQEVAALQGGGNQCAREFYFKEWESQHHSSLDSSNVDRLRDFIKHVYVDKKYSGDRGLSKPPRVKEADKEDMYENKRMDGSRSPYDDNYDPCYNERNSPGGRSDEKNFRNSFDGKIPGYQQGNRQYDNHRSPVHPQVVNDWRREDRFGSGDSKLEGRSPDSQKDVSGPPVVRPVRDILKENVSLQVIDPPKSNPSKTFDGFSQQRTASFSSFGSADGNFVEPKKENLIDFDAEPDFPAAPQAQQVAAIQPISQLVASATSENWASFDVAVEPKAPQVPAPVNTLESVLSQLSVSSPVPVSDNTSGGGTMMSAPVGGASSAPPSGYTSITTFNNAVPTATLGNNFSALPPVGASVGIPTSAPIPPINDVGQWSRVQRQQHTLFPSTGNQLAAHQFTPVVGAVSNQQWNSSLPSHTQVLTTPASAASQAILTRAQETNSVVTSQSPLLQVNTGGRKELPEDTFAAYYSSAPLPRPGWQIGPAVGMGPALQYNNIVAIPTNPQSSNPFDLNVQPLHTSASIPSMASLQGAFSNLPNPASANLLRTSSLGSPSPYTSVVPPRAYMAQQAHSNMFGVSHQMVGDYGNMGPAFMPLDPNPRLAGQYSTPTGGNPFA